MYKLTYFFVPTSNNSTDLKEHVNRKYITHIWLSEIQTIQFLPDDEIGIVSMKYDSYYHITKREYEKLVKEVEFTYNPKEFLLSFLKEVSVYTEETHRDMVDKYLEKHQ